MALNWQLDDEVSTHMNEAMKEERDNPPPPEPDSGPSTPSMAVEKELEKEPEKVEAKVEDKPSERPRNPDGTFAPTKGELKPEEELKAAPKEAPKALEKPVEPPEGYVAHGAFHEERQRRKALQQQVESMEKRWTDLVSKMQEKQQTPPPDPAQDFPGHVQHHFNQFTQKTAELEKKVQGFEQQTTQQQQEQQFLNAYSQAAAEFTSRQPDFNLAYNHWLKSRMEELTDAGYSQEQALHIRGAEERGLVAKAFEDGVNPSERLYAVAKRRGYTNASASPAPETKLDPVEKLKQIEAGQRATPAMGGSGMKPKMTLQAVAAMSDEEFAAMDWERTMRQLTP